MGFGGICVERYFRRLGCTKGGAKTMHGLCSCVGSRHVYLVCICLALQCETVVRVKGVECACAKGEVKG